MSDISWETTQPAINRDIQRKALSWTHLLCGLACIMLVLFTTHSFQFFFADELAGGLAERPSARSNPAYLAYFAAQIALFLVVLFFHLLKNGIRKPFVIAGCYCLFVVGSYFWSISPGSTLVPAVLFSYIVIAAYVISATFTPAQFLKIYFYVLALILVSSFVLLAAGSEVVGNDRYGGGWLLDIEFSGVMSSKNFAGMVYSSAILLAITGNHLGIPNFLRLLVFVMGSVAVLLSNSATAVVIAILLSIMAFSVKARTNGWQRILFFVLVLLVVLIPFIPFISAGDVLGLLGRDATFTGRRFLWDIAFEEFVNYPLLGHGYYAFFDTGNFSPAWRLWEQFRYFLTDTFHNSSVDILISLGVFGVLVMLGTALKSATIVGNASIDPQSRICLALQLGVFLIGSMMEFAIFHHNYIATFILFYTLFAGMWRYSD